MGLDPNVTRRIPTYGSRDTVTGWRLITYPAATQETIEGIFEDRGATRSNLPAGAHVLLDAILCTADPVNDEDQIYHDPSGRYFQVETVQQKWRFDNFERRDCQLRLLSMWEAAAAQATWKTSPDDPMYKVKNYLDTNVRDAEITKDNDTTLASWAAIFKDPPYPMEAEFRASASPVQGLYVVGQPDSEPLFSGSSTPSGYRENVPITINTVDSTACGGAQLLWKMNAELRYVVETYEIGSLTELLNCRPAGTILGGAKVFGVTWTLQYERGLT